ncbi:MULTISPECIES: sarcosine oxidase subunit alpha family protein [unclassified Janthinobacterium]|uniref:sarcosine oxidase subunit alpha family protein n=1 Tax=unclassified Janthinobacterium TaxID=2610881 RepID=UPI00034B509F|nr:MULTISPECIES: sarcosine oxidase subunit alpha family protein [unclassified Janthinobacterium]MEC5158902.1 sarcosine oxidase subunit alpha [Janthinobacterium sp. CG_S6]
MSARLSSGGRVNRRRVLNFTFNGRAYRGLEGDTLASALLANGVSLVARSWKYHRPRGILSAGVEEPNALVQLFDGARTVPNARMTEVALVEGLNARSIHASPSVEFDVKALGGLFSRLIPTGFYYKTFMASQAAWHFFEKHIRAASGLGTSPSEGDPDRYDKRYAHCDVLVVGAGIAGLTAALAAGRSGARVILCDEQAEPGGWLLSSNEMVDQLAAAQWVARALAELAAMPELILLPRTTAFGYLDHDLLALAERRADHLPSGQAPLFRERLWRVRAKQVVLATGAHERPLVFSNNDLPGVMLAGAVSIYVRRYAVLPGRNAVVFTNNDAGHDAALALKDAGAEVRVVDARATASGSLSQRANNAGIKILAGHVVTEARGGKRVSAVMVQAMDAQGRLSGAASTLACDLVALSGGFSPVIHLQCQAGSKAIWDEQRAAFLPGKPAQSERSAGACQGMLTLRDCARDGFAAGVASVQKLGFTAVDKGAPNVASSDAGELRPLWLVPHARGASRAPKQFVDLQNDVAASDIHLAIREGFESIEHVKRYTAMGFGTDQGKTGNINGMGIAAQALGKTIAQVGTTTFRPNYTPVTFGAVAGLELGDAFDPIRTTPIHEWHVRHGALFEDVGQWKRPWYYPRNGEDLHAAVKREVLAVRNGVGTLDGSTLGKIDIQGPDATTLLNWVYSNAWSKLEIGKCRYGLMLDENGMVFDDGVTVRLAEHHYLMHTTSGGAARVLAWMERWLQTEWPHLKVYLTSATDHWSTSIVAGPKSRPLLKKICRDIDFDDAAFPFMSYREGTLAGVKARVMRISFSGERCYEVNVAANDGLRVWEAMHGAGAEFGVTPYGTETMHVLRAEKGYIIIGQDTDGSVSPIDLGMGGLVTKTKDCLGKRSLARADTQRADRKQLVGLLTDDPRFVLSEGAQILNDAPRTIPAPMVGHVTSSYMSPTLDRSIAMALVKGGASRMGERVHVSMRDGRSATATITSPVFLDPQSERQHV